MYRRENWGKGSWSDLAWVPASKLPSWGYTRPDSQSLESDLLTILLSCLPLSLRNTTSPARGCQAYWHSKEPEAAQRKIKAQTHKTFSLCFSHYFWPLMDHRFLSLRICRNGGENRLWETWPNTWMGLHYNSLDLLYFLSNPVPQLWEPQALWLKYKLKIIIQLSRFRV